MLKKYKKQIIIVILFLIVIGSLVGIAILRNIYGYAIFCPIGGIFFITLIWFNYRIKLEKLNNSKENAKTNEIEIIRFILTRKNFTIDRTNYNVLFKFKGNVVLETQDWKVFFPRKGRRNGIRLFGHVNAIKYLNKINTKKS